MLLVRTADYTATNGTSVVLGIAATASDVVNVVAYGAFNVANTYTQAQADARYPLNSIDLSAGKNKIINGDFGINQRSFTTTTTTGNFGFDRFRMDSGDGTVTFDAQTFNPGEPSLGYTAKNYLSCTTTGQTISTAVTALIQKIEDVRTFAATTVTVSFWAKAATGTPKIAVEFRQVFGTGGTPSSTINNYAGQVTIGTNWNRYSVTYTVPSIVGQTIGTDNNSVLWLQLWYSAGSAFNSRTGSIGIQNNTISIWGVQVEAGSVATAFQTASGSVGGELALCQRYYWQLPGTTTGVDILMRVFNIGALTNNLSVQIPFPVTMRIKPTLVAWGDISDGTSKAFDTVVSQQFNGGWAIMNSVPAGGYVDLNFVTASSEL